MVELHAEDVLLAFELIFHLFLQVVFCLTDELEEVVVEVESFLLGIILYRGGKLEIRGRGHFLGVEDCALVFLFDKTELAKDVGRVGSRGIATSLVAADDVPTRPAHAGDGGLAVLRWYAFVSHLAFILLTTKRVYLTFSLLT